MRKKQDGDVFFPMKNEREQVGRKFLKDKKMTTFVKEKIWLLCDAENQVLGVIPYRQDRRFSANNETKKIVKIIL